MKHVSLVKPLAICLSLIFLLVSGCGGQTETSASSSSMETTSTKTIPQDWVATVDGMEITTADLNFAIIDLTEQYSVGESGTELPKPGTPQFTDLEKQVVERLAHEQVLWFEAERMGLTATTDEVNAQIEEYKQASGGTEAFNQQLADNNMTIARLGDQITKNLLFQKLYGEVTRNAVSGANESETMNNQKIAFEQWFESIKGNYEIWYADQYKPAGSSTKTVQ